MGECNTRKKQASIHSLPHSSLCAIIGDMSSIVCEEIGHLIEGLSEERQKMAISYIRFLASEQTLAMPIQTLKRLQSLFQNDTGWSSEEEMLDEMASFRRSRMG